MRLRSLPARATALAVAAAVLCATSTLHADTVDAADPVISPALVNEIDSRLKVRSIIQLKPGHSVNAVAGATEQASAGARVLNATGSRHFFVAEVDRETLAALRRDPRVQAVYKDELYRPLLDSSTSVIRSKQANLAGWTGKGASIAVLDTGIDGDHPFFAGRLVAEACFSSPDPSIGFTSLCPNRQPNQIGPGAADAETEQCLVGGRNACSHGTHVAGIAAGRIATGAPANGVAPSAGIMAVQVFTRVDNPMICGDDSACFLSYTSDLKLALELVAQVAAVYNIAAVNMSLGGGGPFAGPCDGNAEAAALKPEFDALVAQGVAPVVAAGNEGFRNGVASPACVSTAVTVGATDDYDGLAWFTNRGPLLDVFAPGVSVVSSVPGGTYASMSGTSMAAPHVTGLFALMRQAYPGFTVAQSLARLRSTGKAIPYSVNGASVSTPRIDAERATSAAARAAI